ncbi:MAG TPA: hypothetical protein DDZ11_02555 [Lentisphaeria bacterium]|nr:hypothetical protein [Lentisphaeria bacterium]
MGTALLFLFSVYIVTENGFFKRRFVFYGRFFRSIRSFSQNKAVFLPGKLLKQKKLKEKFRKQFDFFKLDCIFHVS